MADKVAKGGTDHTDGDSPRLREEEDATARNTKTEHHITEHDRHESSDGDDEDPTIQGWRFHTVVCSLFFSLLLGAMDSSIVATALVSIGAHFGDFLRLQWVALSYLLANLGFALIFARISDVIGRKWASILAVAVLVFGSLGAGLASSLNMLIAFRAIQGLGGAGVYALPLTVIPEITPIEKFGLISALSGLVFTFSAILGPTIGGVITTHSSWRWCFLFNVPCGVVAMAVMFVTWPNQPVHRGKITWSRLDFPGALLLIIATVLTIFALQEAGSGTFAWSSATIVGSLVGGGLAAVALVAWTILLARRSVFGLEPLVAPRLLKNRVLVGAFLAATFSGYILYTVLIELSERLQIVNGRSAQGAGIDLLPLLGASALGATISGFISTGKRNRSFPALLVAAVFVLIGTSLFTTLDTTITTSTSSTKIPKTLYGYQVVLGFGLGGILVGGTVVIKTAAETRDSAMAQGVQAQTRILGSNIGLAIATILLNARLSSDLSASASHSAVLTPAQLGDLRQSLDVLFTLSPSQQAAVRESFARAFRLQMIVCVGIAVAGVLSIGLIYQRHPVTFAELKSRGIINSEKKTVATATRRTDGNDDVRE